MIMHPKKILFLLIVWPALCRAAPTSQGTSYPEKERDGNIPFVDVEMLPSKRWKDARIGLDNMKKELSFIIDKGNSTSTQHTSGNAELEKEKQRLFDKIDGTRTSRPSLSQLKLIQRILTYFRWQK
ncbi:hypothetical protein X943_000101 [Babesia divergens]|uniref:Uncharacterized protein n=1 Tax=Babesia divergens TaxID=32595 RepID=A0AAD9LJ67_BABDI|nr:hypothetical protein X943_000101 [Babesia divergens]